MSSKVSIVNQKGGVGKTTTAVNLSTALAAMNKKVLIIDLDPQGNSSTAFGIKQEDRVDTIYEVLNKLVPIRESIKSTMIPNLDLITSNTDLSAAESDLFGVSHKEYLLKIFLEDIEKDYDCIIVDCPPALNLLTINALVGCNKILIPMQCDFYSLEGLSHLLKVVKIIGKQLNPEVKIIGVLFTMYDRRNRLTEHVENDVRKCLGSLVFNTVIPRNVKLSEAPSHGKPGIIYDYRCSGSIAYMELTKELLSREDL